MTECSECDARAVRFWGLYAYCRRHLAEAQATEPRAHYCPKCGQQQGPQIMWRGEPCGTCKSKERKRDK